MLSSPIIKHHSISRRSTFVTSLSHGVRKNVNASSLHHLHFLPAILFPSSLRVPATSSNCLVKRNAADKKITVPFLSTYDHVGLLHDDQIRMLLNDFFKRKAICSCVSVNKHFGECGEKELQEVFELFMCVCPFYYEAFVSEPGCGETARIGRIKILLKIDTIAMVLLGSVMMMLQTTDGQYAEHYFTAEKEQDQLMLLVSLRRVIQQALDTFAFSERALNVFDVSLDELKFLLSKVYTTLKEYFSLCGVSQHPAESPNLQSSADHIIPASDCKEFAAHSMEDDYSLFTSVKKLFPPTLSIFLNRICFYLRFYDDPSLGLRYRSRSNKIYHVDDDSQHPPYPIEAVSPPTFAKQRLPEVPYATRNALSWTPISCGWKYIVSIVTNLEIQYIYGKVYAVQIQDLWTKCREQSCSIIQSKYEALSMEQQSNVYCPTVLVTDEYFKVFATYLLEGILNKVPMLGMYPRDEILGVYENCARLLCISHFNFAQMGPEGTSNQCAAVNSSFKFTGISSKEEGAMRRAQDHQFKAPLWGEELAVRITLAAWSDFFDPFPFREQHLKVRAMLAAVFMTSLE